MPEVCNSSTTCLILPLQPFNSQYFQQLSPWLSASPSSPFWWLLWSLLRLLTSSITPMLLI